MPFRLSAFFLLGAVAACNPPAPEKIVVPAKVVEAIVLPPEQVRERTGLCAKATGERFRRDWKESGVSNPEGTLSADFASHYNAKLNICFYLLTVRQFADEEGGVPTGTLRKILFDFGGEELYGQYVGPVMAGSPWDRFMARCKVDELFCTSEAEWDRLARAYMED